LAGKGITLFTHSRNQTWLFHANHYSNQFYPDFPGKPDLPVQEYTRVDPIFVYFVGPDQHYYSFHKSVNDYFYSGDGFPFAESVIVYSNFPGALGVFGGYNIRTYFIGTN